LRQCLWRDKEGEPKQSLAAWEMICKPKIRGGLGIVNFQKQNAALLIKFLDKFYNKRDLPWVRLIWENHYVGRVPHAENLCGSFWWKDVLRQVDNFRAVARVKLGIGDTFLFWTDNWLFDDGVMVLKDKFPRLFSFVLREEIMAAEVYAMEDITDLFYTPLSQSAFTELQQLRLIMQANPITGGADEWTYCWGGAYASAKFYYHIHKHLTVPKVYEWIWKSSCMMKTKVFAWLLLVDRLNTKDLLKRRHWQVTDVYHCELCPLHAYEDRIHLFFECNFSLRIWNYLQFDWRANDDLQMVIAHARKEFAKPFFMEVLMLACWNIWILRNAKIFRGERPTFARWKAGFLHDVWLLRHRIKVKYRDKFLDWIKTLP
jgi:hypothetical protein